MKKLTIGLFIDTFYPMIDGVVMVVDNYAKRLSKVANVIVFAPKPPTCTYDDSNHPYKIVRCNSIALPYIDYNLPIPKIDPKFIKELNKYNLDIVHIHSPATLGLTGLKYAKEHNTLLIGTLHSQYKQDIMRTVKSERLADIILKNVINTYNKCDEVWTVNKALANLLVEEYHYKGIPRIMLNATEMTPVDNPKECIEYINNKYNITSSDKVFLFVGRLNKLKNILFIVDSLVELDKLKPKFNYKMFFVGNGQDEKELKDYVRKNNLTDKIIFTERIESHDTLAKYYSRSDLFLFPSKYDSNSIVQIEAASQKTPTLFIENTITSSTITNNINGFISKDSPIEYAIRINEIMGNKKLYNKVSNNCYKEIYKNWDTVVEEVFNTYKELYKRRNNI